MTAMQTIKPMSEELVTAMFGDKEARWLQIAVVNAVHEALEEGHIRILIIQPTGSGKTISSGLIVIDERIRALLNVPENRKINVLFISHRRRLLTQAESAYAVEESINIIPCSMMSEIPDDLEYDCIIFDEAHHEATISFQYRLETLYEKRKQAAIEAGLEVPRPRPMFGLTANDIDARTDKRLCKFSKIIEPMTRQEAVEAGYLAESDIFSFIDSGRRLIDIGLDIVELYHDIMGQTMAFVKTKEEARELHQMLTAAGYKSALLVDLSEPELNIQLSNFEKGVYQFGISCMKLGEGVDVKGCQSILQLRKLRARGLLNQFIGRAARNDCPCYIFETIDPLTTNLDATSVVGVPKSHTLHYKVRGEWRKLQLT